MSAVPALNDTFSTSNSNEGKVEVTTRSSEPIKHKEVEKAMPELTKLYNRRREAGESFFAACDAVAVKAGLDASVLKTYVKAVVNDKVEEHERKADQLAFLFGELAE